MRASCSDCEQANGSSTRAHARETAPIHPVQFWCWQLIVCGVLIDALEHSGGIKRCHIETYTAGRAD